MEKINRIGVIGDVHTEAKSLSSAIQFLKDWGYDICLCTGDVVDGSGDASQCFEILFQTKVNTVSGNHDRWLLENVLRDLPLATPQDSLSSELLHAIAQLPPIVEIETDQGLLLLCHGLGRNDMARLNPYDEGYALEANPDLQNLLREGKYRYIIGGHTHRRMVRQFNDMTFINAGTLKRNHDPCFLTIDLASNAIQFYNIEAEEQISEGEFYTI